MDDLGDVYTKLFDARNKWFDIGLALNTKFSTLESIESDNSDRLRWMLAHRIQSGGPLTWADLCNCLKHPIVGRRDLADEIYQGLVEVIFISKCLKITGSYYFIESPKLEDLLKPSPRSLNSQGQCYYIQN